MLNSFNNLMTIGISELYCLYLGKSKINERFFFLVVEKIISLKKKSNARFLYGHIIKDVLHI